MYCVFIPLEANVCLSLYSARVPNPLVCLENSRLYLNYLSYFLPWIDCRPAHLDRMDAKLVAQHNNRNSCWIIVKDEVFDVTDFLDQHPGGAGIILKYAGKDATQEYEALHQPGTIEENLAKGWFNREIENTNSKSNVLVR
jgi:hypothetical protein